MDNGAGWEAPFRQLMEDIEGQTAEAMEQMVAGEGFTELLSQVTENLVAWSKIRSDAGDLVLRNLRIAGQADINRLARQLARTEDKLELLLQAVERLEASGQRR
ncbi:MAG: hypothetical protein QOD43_750 [Gaiellaceae bacterium]|jgi:hypothetical protein|nr:hypothetical protein [Gaiellaceae bacterium]